jgi:hypothetical protein
VKPYRFLEEAELEFHETVAYLDRQVAGLGDRFIDAVQATIDHVRTNPNVGSRISKMVRKAVLRRFPYNVLYVDDPQGIVIVAIAPHKRRPGYWRKRLRSRRT